MINGYVLAIIIGIKSLIINIFLRSVDEVCSMFMDLEKSILVNISEIHEVEMIIDDLNESKIFPSHTDGGVTIINARVDVDKSSCV